MYRRRKVYDFFMVIFDFRFFECVGDIGVLIFRVKLKLWKRVNFFYFSDFLILVIEKY